MSVEEVDVTMADASEVCVLDCTTSHELLTISLSSVTEEGKEKGKRRNFGPSGGPFSFGASFSAEEIVEEIAQNNQKR